MSKIDGSGIKRSIDRRSFLGIAGLLQSRQLHAAFQRPLLLSRARKRTYMDDASWDRSKCLQWVSASRT